MGLVSFEGTNRTQDKLYAFFKEKNTAGDPESDMWLPFVAQVCKVSLHNLHCQFE